MPHWKPSDNTIEECENEINILNEKIKALPKNSVLLSIYKLNRSKWWQRRRLIINKQKIKELSA